MKRHRAVAVLFALAFAPGIAAADKDGFYLSLGGLYVLPSDLDASYTEGNLELAGTVPLDGGPGFTAAVGYGAASGLRGEIELGYGRSEQVDRVIIVKLVARWWAGVWDRRAFRSWSTI